MKSIFGDNIQISLFGESHSKAIGVVINGIAPGITLDLDFVNSCIDKRKPKGRISTSRQEEDELNFLSGYFNGKTTGTPLCIMIENKSQKSKDYEKTKDLARPSHADFTANEKYLSFQDYRGGGHFSGRLTTPIVAAGAIALQILKSKGIEIGTHINFLHSIHDEPFSEDESILKEQIVSVNEKYFPVIDDKMGEKMQSLIEGMAKKGDSVGGILETTVLNMPKGVGEPFFSSIESKLSSILFSVPAVKGVEFGKGFEFSKMTGSIANDSFYMADGEIKTKTNNNGGINGGISNGMPISFKTVIKPTPSIYLPQQTVDMKDKKDTVLQIEGRHDPAIIHRARIVIDSVTAIALLDLMVERYGYLWMREDTDL